MDFKFGTHILPLKKSAITWRGNEANITMDVISRMKREGNRYLVFFRVVRLFIVLFLYGDLFQGVLASWLKEVPTKVRRKNEGEFKLANTIYYKGLWSQVLR